MTIVSMAQLGDVEGLARVLAVSGCDLEEEDPHGLRALQVSASSTSLLRRTRRVVRWCACDHVYCCRTGLLN